MKTFLKAYGFFLAILGADLLLSLFSPTLAWLSTRNALRFLWEVLLIVPLVMVLIALFDAWVPRKLVEEHIGPASGIRGAALAILLGTAAAGPLYAAFPIAVSLQRKGARLANLVIFLGTWATIKIPMLLLESRFVGLRFALVRLALTVPGVLAMGFLMERLMPSSASPRPTS
jgi:uncharacterized membrane protein YraQ (UPF0718 family)